ncbi:MAG: GAF domain-containing protein [Polyangiaceae bacterium]|nr:GAF domain-containing protein [Polyangiaceae bacterium]
MAELFEACVDIAFLADPLEAADFVLALTLEKIPSAVGLVSFFDINKREFVVVRQVGGESALLARLPDRSPLAHAAMRSRRAVVIADASKDARAADDRWRATGAERRSLICAPVELAGRTLGLIEIADPLDGGRYTEGDGNALTYIGQQLAESLAAHGVIVEAELVLAGLQDTAARRAR